MTASGSLYTVQQLALGVMVKPIKWRKMYRALFIERINHWRMRTAVSRSNGPSIWFSPPSLWDVGTMLQHSVSSLCPSSHSVVITQSPSVLLLLNLNRSQPALKAVGASTALLIQLKCYGVQQQAMVNWPYSFGAVTGLLFLFTYFSYILFFQLSDCLFMFQNDDD